MNSLRISGKITTGITLSKFQINSGFAKEFLEKKIKNKFKSYTAK